MVIKIYALIWLLVMGAGALLYFTGNSNEITLTVFAFIVSALFAMGIFAVLPWWVDKKYTWRY